MFCWTQQCREIYLWFMNTRTNNLLTITMTSRDCVCCIVRPGVRFMYGVTHVLCVSLMCLSLCVMNATFSAAYLFVTLSATRPLWRVFICDVCSSFLLCGEFVVFVSRVHFTSCYPRRVVNVKGCVVCYFLRFLFIRGEYVAFIWFIRLLCFILDVVDITLCAVPSFVCFAFQYL